MLRIMLLFLRAIFVSRTRLITENLVLRHQLTILLSCAKRPRLRQRDRAFWVWFSRLRKDWRAFLLIVKPETVEFIVAARQGQPGTVACPLHRQRLATA